MKTVWIIIGAVAMVMGAVWTLQGLNILGGSPMTGHTIWAVVGPIVIVVGILLTLLGVRRKDSSGH